MALSTHDFAAKHAPTGGTHGKYMAARLDASKGNNEHLQGFLDEFAATPEIAAAMLHDLGKGEKSPLVAKVEAEIEAEPKSDTKPETKKAD